MITAEQLHLLAKQEKISESVIFREYLQLIFLKELYAQQGSPKIIFKGGTAIHLIYHSPRFSEDLDFTVEAKRADFLKIIAKVFNNLSQQEEINFKEKRSLAGKKFLLTAQPSILPYKTFVNLDFSFREKILTPEKSILKTRFPVIFTSYVYHLSKEEMLAEKIRALMTRTQGRDLYDIWYLLTQGAVFKPVLIREKLKYYHLTNISRQNILQRIQKFSKKDFIVDLKPFVPLNQRDQLGSFFDYLRDYLQKNLSEAKLPMVDDK